MEQLQWLRSSYIGAEIVGFVAGGVSVPQAARESTRAKAKSMANSFFIMGLLPYVEMISV